MQILDIRSPTAELAPVSPTPPIEFVRIELSTLADGALLVCLTATMVDDEEAQLLDREIAVERASTMEDVLALIRAHIRLAPSAH